LYDVEEAGRRKAAMTTPFNSSHPPPASVHNPAVDFLSTLPAGRGDRRLALAVVLVSAAIFIALAPFATVPLAPVSAFIPIYQSVLVINDLITAVLLFGPFSLRSRALLVLASGYLFTALMAVTHLLTFPGLFAPTGLLGAGLQSTAWLYMFWHGGFPLFVVAYALLKDGDREPSGARDRTPVAILGSAAAVLVVAGGLTLMATAGQKALPEIMLGNRYTPAMMVVVSSTWMSSLVALAVVGWRRPHGLLDVWLMVVMCAWLFDIALSAVLNAGRFDLGFYAGRIYGLLAATFVLVVLLFESGKLQARLAAVNAELASEVAERRRAEAEAAAANHAKSEFLSRMSHELRTPLNAILGFGQLLQMRGDEGGDRESVEQILKGGRHLLDLINEVLDISRIESGRLPLSPEPVQVGEAIRRVVDLARPLAAERRIDLQVTGVTLHERYALADSQRLQQVLLNLLSNAIKYNREGGRVTVTCREAGAGWLRLTVADTGAGIALEKQSRLFTPFDRLGAEAGGVEGTGLGLALSKRLVEAMGGRIGLESVQGGGSVFWIELAETVSPDVRAGLDAATPAAMARPWRGVILYIEDNPSNLRLVERVLAEQPAIRFIAAMQGRLGLSLAREHRPDLVLLDLHLPDLSGEEVLREIKNDPALGRTPVIVLSADATPGHIRRLVAAGARAYLTKPLDVQQLLAHIDAVLAAA